MGAIRYLLDTHTFLWAVREDWKLSPAARDVIEDTSSHLLVSSVSAFEVTNKHRLGKLDEYADLVDGFLPALRGLGVRELPLSALHAHYAGRMEWTHRDPFDRMLAAQATVEGLVLITKDPAFAQLPWVKTLW